MNVKKYRATTTREALEQVKRDLGEEAFVLETKQVRTGGFLGFKSATQIEISAAAPLGENFSGKPRVTPAAKAAKQNLSIKDDTPARPQHQPQQFDEAHETRDNAAENLAAALNSRAALMDYFETSAPVAAVAAYSAANGANKTNVSKPQKAIEAVEISPDAPRFVNFKKETIAQPVPEKPLAAMPMNSPALVETVPATSSSREFEVLRAELRELKFSLGTLAQRQTAASARDEIGFEEHGEVFDSPFYEAYLELTASGIAPEFARQMMSDVIPQYKDGLISGDLAQHALAQACAAKIEFLDNPLAAEKPAVMALIGATGVGKTTTVAKLAAHVALYDRRRVELLTLDTYRIAAVEQLKTYAEIIGAGCHVVRSVFELDATLRRLPTDATVLIDTTGRNPHDLADQYELSEYLRQRPEIRKCLAVQATTHLHDGIAAIRKFELYGADCLALTKLDETTRPGAMFELAAESNLPLAYLCAGQRVPEDWQSATSERFAAQILRQTK